MITIGEKVWNRLRTEGGFVHTTADGRKFVRFNRGCRCSPELRDLLKRHNEDLKEFIDARHSADDRAWSRLATSRDQGSFQAVGRQDPKARGGDICDCNAVARLPISGESADFRPGRHRPAKTAAISAVAALLALSFAAISEILGTKDPAVDFKMCAFNESSSGGGARVCLTLEANQTRGVEK